MFTKRVNLKPKKQSLARSVAERLHKSKWSLSGAPPPGPPPISEEEEVPLDKTEGGLLTVPITVGNWRTHLDVLRDYEFNLLPEFQDEEEFMEQNLFKQRIFVETEVNTPLTPLVKAAEFQSIWEMLNSQNRNFSFLPGHEGLCLNLMKFLKISDVPTLTIICGPPGSGKTTLAKSVVENLLKWKLSFLDSFPLRRPITSHTFNMSQRIVLCVDNYDSLFSREERRLAFESLNKIKENHIIIITDEMYLCPKEWKSKNIIRVPEFIREDLLIKYIRAVVGIPIDHKFLSSVLAVSHDLRKMNSALMSCLIEGGGGSSHSSNLPSNLKQRDLNSWTAIHESLNDEKAALDWGSKAMDAYVHGYIGSQQIHSFTEAIAALEALSLNDSWLLKMVLRRHGFNRKPMPFKAMLDSTQRMKAAASYKEEEGDFEKVTTSTAPSSPSKGGRSNFQRRRSSVLLKFSRASSTLPQNSTDVFFNSKMGTEKGVEVWLKYYEECLKSAAAEERPLSRNRSQLKFIDGNCRAVKVVAPISDFLL